MIAVVFIIEQGVLVMNRRLMTQTCLLDCASCYGWKMFVCGVKRCAPIVQSIDV